MLNHVYCSRSEHEDLVLCVIAWLNDMQVCEESCGYMLKLMYLHELFYGCKLYVVYMIIHKL